MRISDWSSDVCSSDLSARRGLQPGHQPAGTLLASDRELPVVAPGTVDVQVARRIADLADPELLHHPQGVGVLRADRDLHPVQAEIGRASCRDRVCSYV